MSYARIIKEKVARGVELGKPIIDYCVRSGPYDPKLIEYLQQGRIYDALQYARNLNYEVLVLSLESVLQTIKEEYPSERS